MWNFRKLFQSQVFQEAQAAEKAATQKAWGLSGELLRGNLTDQKFYGLVDDLNRASDVTCVNVRALETAIRIPTTLTPEQARTAFYHLLHVSIFPADRTPQEIHARLEAAHRLLKDGHGHMNERRNSSDLSPVWHLGYLAHEAAVPEAHVGYSADIWNAKRIKQWKDENFGGQGLKFLTELVESDAVSPLETFDAIQFITSLGITEGNHIQGIGALARVTRHLDAQGTLPEFEGALRKAARDLLEYSTSVASMKRNSGNLLDSMLREQFQSASFQRALGDDVKLLRVLTAAIEFSPRAVHVQRLEDARKDAGFLPRMRLVGAD